LELDAHLRGYFNEVRFETRANRSFSTLQLTLQDLQDVRTLALTNEQVDQWNHTRNLQCFEVFTANENLSGQSSERRAQQGWSPNIYRLTRAGPQVVHPDEDSLSVERKYAL